MDWKPACFVCFATFLFAQVESGTIVGTVIDQAGAVVPNAKITLTNDATKFTRQTQTAWVSFGKQQWVTSRGRFRPAQGNTEFILWTTAPTVRMPSCSDFPYGMAAQSGFWSDLWNR